MTPWLGIKAGIVTLLCGCLNYYAIDGNIFHFSVQTKLTAET